MTSTPPPGPSADPDAGPDAGPAGDATALLTAEHLRRPGSGRPLEQAVAGVRATGAGSATVEVRRARDDEDTAAAARLRWRWVVDEGGATSTAVADEAAFVTATAAWAREHARSHRCFVAVRGERVVGMAWLALVDRVPSPRSMHRLTGDVQSVYVAPEERGAGVGAQLVAAALAAAREAGAERATVHSSERAVALYARAGFTDDARLRHAVLGEPGGAR